MNPAQTVSPREIEILHLVANEYTTKEIASKLFISKHTADSHRKNLMSKLDVKNSAGLVRRGFEAGILQIVPLVLIVVMSLFISDAYAGHSTWKLVPVNNDWFHAPNWDNGVPMTGDTATISADSVIINAPADLVHVELLNGARLVVTPSGVLSLNSSIVAIVATDAIIYNYGLIEIQSSLSTGFSLQGTTTLNNFSGAIINIIGTGTAPMICTSMTTVKNQSGARIFIDVCQEPVIANGLFDNRGEFHCNISGQEAIRNIGVFENRGSILIDSSSAEGIINGMNAKFQNFDTLRIRRTFKEGIINHGDFQNGNNGYLTIDEGGNKGFDNLSTGETDNNGFIMVSNVSSEGIKTNGVFVNSDSLKVTGTGDFGISVINSVFHNEVGGVVHIYDQNFTALYLEAEEFLINDGKILIEDVINGNNGILGGNIKNFGSIQIDNVDGDGIVHSFLNNRPGALAAIRNCGGNGIEGEIENRGKITIDSVDEIGIRLLANLTNYDSIFIVKAGGFGIWADEEDIVNEVSGVIHVSNIDGVGLQLQSDDKNSFRNAGIVEIYNTGSHGVNFCSDYTFVNENNLIISTVSGSGLIHDDSLSNLAGANIEISEVNSSSPGWLANKSNALLLNEGMISIRNGGGHGLENLSGTINNSDSIIIGNIVKKGIINMSEFNNSGYVYVTDTEQVGIQNELSFTNEFGGQILLDSTGIGIVNMDSLKNFGTVEIVEADSLAGMTNDAYFLNEGLWWIRNSKVSGIENNGEVINTDTMRLINLAKIGLVNHSEFDNMGYLDVNYCDRIGIQNEMRLINHAGSEILLDSTGAGIVNRDTLKNMGSITIIEMDSIAGLWNGDYVLNEGMLRIENGLELSAGISNRSKLTNLDSIIISNINYNGFTNSKSLYNSATGYVSISMASRAINNVTSTGEIVNYGEIRSNESELGLYNSGVISNYASIDISDMTVAGISNIDSIYNHSEGEINIFNCLDGFLNGSVTREFAYFQNNGFMLIDSTLKYGIQNFGLINNADSLFINNTDSYGFYNFDTFHNQDTALVTISNTGDYGLFNDFEKSAINDGIIYIYLTESAGLLNSGSFINNDSIRIEYTVTNGIWNHLGNFENAPTGRIDMSVVMGDDRSLLLNEFSGTFLNRGWLTLDDTGIIASENTYGLRCTSNSTLFQNFPSGTLIVRGVSAPGNSLEIEEGTNFISNGILEIFN